MTKFTDRLENDLEQIADRATPSPTAWQSIQQRMAEPDTTRAREIIMLTAEPEIDREPTEPRRQWLLAAAAVVILAIAVGVIIRSGDDGAVVADQPEEQSGTTVTTVDEVSTPLLPGLPLPTGPVNTDLLGVTMAFEAPGPMEVVYAKPGEFQLFYDQPDGAIRVFVANRIGGWYTQSESVDRVSREPGSMDPNDLEAWFAENETDADRRPDTTISGRTVEVWDFGVNPDLEGSLFDDCPRCVKGSSVVPFDPLVVQQQNRIVNPFLAFRLWFVRIDGMEPIGIWAAADAENPAWLDEFEATILPTIELGPDAPPLDG